MSRFKNEVIHLESHVKTLRVCVLLMLLITLGAGIGWWHAPRELTIHVPPDLRSGSSRKWWDVPPESVYAFTVYIFQQLHRWPNDGEDDYKRNIFALSAYFTPSCKTYLDEDYANRRDSGELRNRVRGIYEIPGRTYGDDPALRVRNISNGDWIVTLDVAADEYYRGERVKRAFVRYSLKVVRSDIDAEKNPFGLAVDCFAATPQRIALPDASTPGANQ